MNKIIKFVILFLFVHLSLFAHKDEDKTKMDSSSRIMKTWLLDGQLGVADSVSLDTAYINYNEKSVIRKLSIANLYNGNYGSPIQTKIFFDRPEKTDFIFESAYKPYLSDIESTLFYDVNFPFTNLTYLTGGPFGQKEEQVKFNFSAGPSKRINSALNLDYIHSVGMFNNQATRRFSGSLNGRYEGRRYAANALVYTNNHYNHENGGLTDLTLLNNPDVDVLTRDMPTAIRAYSAFHKTGFLFNHGYNIGFYRELKDSISDVVNDSIGLETDSVRFEFVPVTRFAHTLKLNEMKKRYYEPSVQRDFYANTFLPDTIRMANDTAAVRSITNLVSINIVEEFNKWLKFGLTGYVENEVQQFTYRPDSLLLHAVKSNTRVGGILSKSQGERFRYNFLGDIYITGYKLGEFRLEANLFGKLNFRKEIVELRANAFVRNEEPSFYLQNYYSSHFRWENSFGKTYKTHMGGELKLPRRRTKLRVNVENITDYIYFDEDALPVQDKGNVQVLAADLQQDFKFGRMFLENHIIYQASSNKEVLPLPDLALFHNLYYADKWFVDFYLQIGASVRYHTNYLAPSYMPAIGQFYNQKDVMVGNYPELNVYGNFHIKQARIFVEYTNLGRYMIDGWGLSMPNYPINPPMFKMGVSWNFFN